MLKALIACFDNWNTLSEVPYIVKKGGFGVDVFCGDKSWLLKNRFYDNWIPAKGNAEDYGRQLIELVKSSNYDWIILGDEKIIKLLNDTVTDEKLFYKILPLTKIENREMLSSKGGLSNVCIKYNVRTPGYLVHTASKANVPNISSMQFPLIIKFDFSWGGVGIKVLNNIQEFETALSDVPDGETLIIQEYIIGKEVPVEALFWKGRLLTLASSEILKYDKDEFTYSTRRRYFPVDESLKDEIAYFGKSAGIHGFVNMAYMRSAAGGLHYLIEADIRPSSWSAYTKYAGNAFTQALHSIVDPDFKPKFSQKTVEIALFHKDIRRALYSHDIKGLLQWLYKPSYWKYIPFYDHKLLASTISEIWKEFVVEKANRAFTGKKI